MNRYEVYLLARQAELTVPSEQEQPSIRRFWTPYGPDFVTHRPEIKSDAVRYAEKYAEDLDDLIRDAWFMKTVPYGFGRQELTWNTPFGMVICRRSRNPEALHGWIFVEA